MPKVKVNVANVMISQGRFYLGDEVDIPASEITEINQIRENALTVVEAPKKKATKK